MNRVPYALSSRDVARVSMPPRRRVLWRMVRWLVILTVWSGVALAVMLVWLARDLPRPETALDAARRPGLTLVDRSGASFAIFGDVVGEPLRMRDLPPELPAAAVAVEDHRFWSHPGIDILGIGRAVYINVRAGHLVQGGSTITQQVAKNLFLTNARTFRRKVQELMLTAWLEKTFSKAEILEIWLNRVYLGSGAWGVDAAARLYFGVSARNLLPWQSAVLAGLPRAPSRINPRSDPVAATARAKEVLAAMANTGAISAAQAAAIGGQIAFSPRPATAGWFADWVADDAQAAIPTGSDAVLRTTLDPKAQAVVERRLAALFAGAATGANLGQAAIVVLDIKSGAVRAMVGGRDYRTSPYNRAVVAKRQPGSAFKVFVWLAALEHGLHPDDLVLDAPIRLGAWSPQNFDGIYRGEISLEEALAQSANTVAIRLMQESGGPRGVSAIARRLGVASPMPQDLSLALGTGETSVLQLAGAYATILNGGRLVTPTGIESIEADHHSVAIARPGMEQVVTPALSGLMRQMMTAVVTRGSGRAASLPGRLVAGKTGTTQDSRDAWFIGEVGGTLIAIWLGNDDARPMKDVSGGGLPAKLFHDIAADLR